MLSFLSVLLFPSLRKRAMADCQEQRVAVKFCFLLGKTPAETVAMIKTSYGDIVLLKTNVVLDDPKLQKRTKIIHLFVKIWEMSGISWNSIQRILWKYKHMRIIATSSSGLSWAAKLVQRGPRFFQQSHYWWESRCYGYDS